MINNKSKVIFHEWKQHMSYYAWNGFNGKIILLFRTLQRAMESLGQKKWKSSTEKPHSLSKFFSPRIRIEMLTKVFTLKTKFLISRFLSGFQSPTLAYFFDKIIILVELAAMWWWERQKGILKKPCADWKWNICRRSGWRGMRLRPGMPWQGTSGTWMLLLKVFCDTSTNLSYSEQGHLHFTRFTVICQIQMCCDIFSKIMISF